MLQTSREGGDDHGQAHRLVHDDRPQGEEPEHTDQQRQPELRAAETDHAAEQPYAAPAANATGIDRRRTLRDRTVSTGLPAAVGSGPVTANRNRRCPDEIVGQPVGWSACLVGEPGGQPEGLGAGFEAIFAASAPPQPQPD
jgi:hypothetical protein